jgi:hypothetical protein
LSAERVPLMHPFSGDRSPAKGYLGSAERVPGHFADLRKRSTIYKEPTTATIAAWCATTRTRRVSPIALVGQLLQRTPLDLSERSGASRGAGGRGGVQPPHQDRRPDPEATAVSGSNVVVRTAGDCASPGHPLRRVAPRHDAAPTLNDANPAPRFLQRVTSDKARAPRTEEGTDRPRFAVRCYSAGSRGGSACRAPCTDPARARCRPARAGRHADRPGRPPR